MSEARLAKQSPQGLLGTWEKLVNDYSHRELTNSSDKLVAFSGLAKIMHQHLGIDEYLAGLWRSALLPQLMWTRSYPGELRFDTPQSDYSLDQSASLLPYVDHKYLAPSWSWASKLYMPIMFLDCRDDRLIPGTAIDHADTYIKLLSADPYGAVVDGQVKLRAMVVDLGARPPSKRDWEFWDLTEPPNACVAVNPDVSGESSLEMTGILLYKAVPRVRHTYYGLLIEPESPLEPTYTRMRTFKRKGAFRILLGKCPRQYRKPELWLKWETIILK